MAKKLDINLLISQTMSSKKEHGVIRFPLRVRNYLSLSEDTLLLGKGSLEMEVKIKQTYKEDMLRLGKMRRKGEVTEDVALVTGFVSRSTFQRLAAREQGECVWISDDKASITVGCDPEFGLVAENGYLTRGDVALPGSKLSPFGADGPGVEVRPPPSRDHFEIVKSIKDILSNPPAGAKELRWLGGATYKDTSRVYWFGGHIHLGRPKGINSSSTADKCFKSLAKILDHYLALPLLSFDTPNPHYRRNGCKGLHYGHASDIRVKEGYSRFEYRTLSGLWLTHPELAKIIVGVTKAVAEDFYQRAADIDYDQRVLNRGATELAKVLGFKLANVTEINAVINDATCAALEPKHMSYWLKLMESLKNREEYSEEVDALIALVEASPSIVVPQLSMDLRDNWQGGRPLLPKPSAKLKQALAAVENKK